MAIGVWQLVHKPALAQWNTDNYYAVVVSASSSLTDALDTYSDVSANQVGSAINVAGKSVSTGQSEIRYLHGDLDWGTGLSFTNAKWVCIFKGTHSSPGANDPAVAYINLDVAGGSVNATSFVIRADATRGIGGITQTN